jgi:hypothetical protein
MLKQATVVGLLTLTGLLVLSCQKPDTTPPTVVSTIPQDSATGVVLNANIVVTFSEPMDTASVHQAFTINPPLTGAFSWTDSTLTFNPDTNLDTNKLYAVTITTAAQDRAGNALASEYWFSFTTGTQVTSGVIYMMGRSVTENWFKHWGWDFDDSHPVTHGRFNLYHRSVEGPDNGAQAMVNSVKGLLQNIPADPKPVIFFKLCFVDFYGGSPEEADTNRTRNQGIIDSVYNIVTQQYGYDIIFGNALPRTAGETDQFLVSNHEQYNQYLDSLHTQHPDDVFVFDLYSVLTDTATGGIKSAYATAADDAHPNEAGYDVLDTPFLNFLETNF